MMRQHLRAGAGRAERRERREETHKLAHQVTLRREVGQVNRADHESTRLHGAPVADRRAPRATSVRPFEFLCAGEMLEAWPSGALHWPSRRLLAVADLHLEKGSSYAVNALKLLPRHDTRQTLSALGALIAALRPETVVCLGDSFHDRDAVARLPKEERAEIERLTRLAKFIWIAGNHDPAPPP